MYGGRDVGGRARFKDFGLNSASSFCPGEALLQYEKSSLIKHREGCATGAETQPGRSLLEGTISISVKKEDPTTAFRLWTS